MPNGNGQAGTGGNGSAWLTNYGTGPDDYCKFYSNPDNTRAAIADLDEIVRNSTAPQNKQCAEDIRDAYQHFLAHLEANPEAEHNDAFFEVEEVMVRYWGAQRSGFSTVTTDTEARVSDAMQKMVITLASYVDGVLKSREPSASPEDAVWNMPESLEDVIKVFKDKDSKIDQMIDYLEDMGISSLDYLSNKDVEASRLLSMPMPAVMGQPRGIKRSRAC